jgi:hypothetical protein
VICEVICGVALRPGGFAMARQGSFHRLMEGCPASQRGSRVILID